MLTGDEYDYLYRNFGKAVADAELHRRMRLFKMKLAAAWIVLAAIFVLSFFVF